MPASEEAVDSTGSGKASPNATIAPPGALKAPGIGKTLRKRRGRVPERAGHAAGRDVAGEERDGGAGPGAGTPRDALRPNEGSHRLQPSSAYPAPLGPSNVLSL